jgi:hypothetical protein
MMCLASLDLDSFMKVFSSHNLSSLLAQAYKISSYTHWVLRVLGECVRAFLHGRLYKLII